MLRPIAVNPGLMSALPKLRADLQSGSSHHSFNVETHHGQPGVNVHRPALDLQLEPLLLESDGSR